MAKFKPNPRDRLDFNVQPDAPMVRSFIPEMECSEAQTEVDQFEQTGKVATEYLIMLLQHLSDSEISHDADCPYHRPDVRTRVQQYYDWYMQAEF